MSKTDILPAGKTCISIKTIGFPKHGNYSAQYEFEIRCPNIPFMVVIPGNYQGYDNCQPSFIEQETWLDELAENAENGIVRSSDCGWNIKDETALRRFLQMLEPYRVETNYY